MCARSLLIPLSHVRQAGGSYARSGRSALPSGWSSAKTPDGKGVYYYNDATGETLHRTHFSHMSHPTFPISHLLFPFFLVSPTHPFLPYVAPHFSHISPFILVFLPQHGSQRCRVDKLRVRRLAPCGRRLARALPHPSDARHDGTLRRPSVHRRAARHQIRKVIFFFSHSPHSPPYVTPRVSLLHLPGTLLIRQGEDHLRAPADRGAREGASDAAAERGRAHRVALEPRLQRQPLGERRLRGRSEPHVELPRVQVHPRP